MARAWDPCGQLRVCSDLDDIDPRRSRNILKRPLTCVHEVDIELTLCVLMDASGHAYAARLRNAFQAHGYVHAITENVTTIDDDVADIDANAEFDPLLLRYTRVAFRHATLDIDGAANRVDHAWEFSEHPIAGILN